MYYVAFEQYEEYNQFEGSWSKSWQDFAEYDDADKFRARISRTSDYRNVSKVLTTA